MEHLKDNVEAYGKCIDNTTKPKEVLWGPIRVRTRLVEFIKVICRRNGCRSRCTNRDSLSAWLLRSDIPTYMMSSSSKEQYINDRSQSQNYLPFYLESRYSRLLVNLSHQTVKDNRFRQRFLHLLVIVFSILIVSDTDELLIPVWSGENQRCYTQHVLWWDFGRWRWRAFELERVDAYWNRSNETIVKLLI